MIELRVIKITPDIGINGGLHGQVMMRTPPKRNLVRMT
jgi:hypothetical protein